jgi:hypothetical protein
LFDVTTGNDGSCGIPNCFATTGWDGPTGLGTPNGINAFSSLGVTQGDEFATAGFPANLPTAVTGGTGFYAFSATGLPPGLSIDPSSGFISGTPTTAGSYTVQVNVTDQAGATAQGSFVLTVNTVVPDVVGRSLTDANSLLRAAGLSSPSERFVADCDDPRNTVLDQSPQPERVCRKASP